MSGIRVVTSKQFSFLQRFVSSVHVQTRVAQTLNLPDKYECSKISPFRCSIYLLINKRNFIVFTNNTSKKIVFYTLKNSYVAHVQFSRKLNFFQRQTCCEDNSPYTVSFDTRQTGSDLHPRVSEGLLHCARGPSSGFITHKYKYIYPCCVHCLQFNVPIP